MKLQNSSGGMTILYSSKTAIHTEHGSSEHHKCSVCWMKLVSPGVASGTGLPFMCRNYGNTVSTLCWNILADDEAWCEMDNLGWDFNWHTVTSSHTSRWALWNSSTCRWPGSCFEWHAQLYSVLLLVSTMTCHGWTKHQFWNFYDWWHRSCYTD